MAWFNLRSRVSNLRNDVQVGIVLDLFLIIVSERHVLTPLAKFQASSRPIPIRRYAALYNRLIINPDLLVSFLLWFAHL